MEWSGFLLWRIRCSCSFSCCTRIFVLRFVLLYILPSLFVLLLSSRLCAPFCILDPVALYHYSIDRILLRIVVCCAPVPVV